MVERPSSSRGDVALDGVVAYDRGSPVCLRSLFTIVDVLRKYTFFFRLGHSVRCDTGDQLRSCLPKVRVVVLFMLYSFSFFLALGPHLNVANSRSSCAIGVPGVRVCGCGDNSNRVISV